MHPDVRDKLKRALTGRETVEMGQFKWVNLDMVREEAGEDWDRLRRKIYDTSAGFIERRLEQGDVLLRARGGFMIIFAELEGDDAAEKVEEIALALNVFFLGDRILRSLKIEAEARSISPEEFMQIVAATVQLDAPQPTSARERGDEPEEAAPEGGMLAKWRESGDGAAREADPSDTEKPVSAARGEESPDWKKARTEIGPDEKADWKDAQAGRASEDPADWTELESAPPEDGDIDWEEGRPTFSRERLPQWEKNRHEKRKHSDPVARPVAFFVEPAGQWDDMVFKPCWDSHREILAAQFCLARRQDQGVVLYGRDTLMGNDSPELHAALDRSVAVAAHKGFQECFNEGPLSPIGIPVHYDSIAKISDRVSYFSLMQAVPKHMRKHFLLRVDGIPRGAPVAQMQEVFRSLKGFGSFVWAKLDFGETDLKRFEGCGIDMFGCDLPRRFAGHNIDERDIHTLVKLVTAARDLRAEAFLTEVDDFDGLNLAMSTGVRFMSGEAVATETPLPAAPAPLKMSEIAQRARPPEDDQDIAYL